MADIGEDKPATAVPASLTDAQAERYIAVHFDNYGYSWIASCQSWRYGSDDQAWIVSWTNRAEPQAPGGPHGGGV